MVSLSGLGAYAAFTLFLSSLLALRGTNVQAHMARARWRADANPLIAHAATLWAPGPRWIRGRRYMDRSRRLDSAISNDQREWARYLSLRAEFKAWNDLETAVAIAVPASAIGGVLAVIDLVMK